jgi:hypothetical protein
MHNALSEISDSAFINSTYERKRISFSDKLPISKE